MRTIAIKVLRNRLSEYVRLAQTGETILVTDRDQVVAEIHPPSPGRALALADPQLTEAVRQGWITPPVLVSASPPPSQPVAPLSRILRDLAADRAEG